MLTVDEGVILIAVLVGMGECYLDIFPFQMNDRIERIDRHILRQQIQQTVLRNEFLAVIDERQTGVEVGIVTQQLLDIIIAETVVLKEPFAVIRHKLDDRTAFLSAVVIEDSCIVGQLTLRELRLARFAFAIRSDREIG